MVEDDDVDVFGASYSNRTVLLNVSGCSSFCCLRSSFTYVDVPHSVLFVLFLSSPDATACRPAISSSLTRSVSTSAAPFSSRQMRPSVDPPSVSRALFFSLSFVLVDTTHQHSTHNQHIAHISRTVLSTSVVVSVLIVSQHSCSSSGRTVLHGLHAYLWFKEKNRFTS